VAGVITPIEPDLSVVTVSDSVPVLELVTVPVSVYDLLKVSCVYPFLSLVTVPVSVYDLLKVSSVYPVFSVVTLSDSVPVFEFVTVPVSVYDLLKVSLVLPECVSDVFKGSLLSIVSFVVPAVSLTAPPLKP
jgi:hypothetical protein